MTILIYDQASINVISMNTLSWLYSPEDFTVNENKKENKVEIKKEEETKNLSRSFQISSVLGHLFRPFTILPLPLLPNLSWG